MKNQSNVVIYADFNRKLVLNKDNLRECKACHEYIHPADGLYRLDDNEIVCMDCVHILVDLKLIRLY